MKHYSESFNKRSRLIVAPPLAEEGTRALAAADGTSLKARLGEVLQVHQDFFPCFDWVFPPPVFPRAAAPRHAAELFEHPSVVPGAYSVYAHVPFCKTLCSFCYYPVLPGRGSVEKSAYVDALVREMAMYRQAVPGARCESVYIGGGTPTALEDGQLTRLFEALHATFDLQPGTEITIESAPGTLPRERALLLRQLGVTRLSYGIQSLDEKLLATMNRQYSVAEARRELDGALAVIGNVNVDTMYGFEGEPASALEDTLRDFDRMGVPCLSIYALDPQRSVRKTVWVGPPRDDLFYRNIDTFHRAKDLLGELGFVSLFQNTFARPRRGPYHHQLRRWENVSLIGLGVGAMGYAPRRPYQNYGTTSAYLKHVDAGVLPIEAVDDLAPEMELARQVTTQLRFTEVDLRQVQERYGVSLEVVFADLLRALVELGFVGRRGDVIRLTEAAAPYNNVLPMLLSPDAFKRDLLALPADYLATMPTPAVLTRLGATQSAPFGMDAEATTVREPCGSSGSGFYPSGSCPGLTG
jgi:oxygen-independent coproporphyrinogen-3 oxidase